MSKPGYQAVPVTAAMEISARFHKSMVVVIYYDAVHRMTHTTTYGRSAYDKEQAAAAGEICAKAVGADLRKMIKHEDFHDDYNPALYKEAIELLKDLNGSNQGTCAEVVNFGFRIKALLHAHATGKPLAPPPASTLGSGTPYAGDEG